MIGPMSGYASRNNHQMARIKKNEITREPMNLAISQAIALPLPAFARAAAAAGTGAVGGAWDVVVAVICCLPFRCCSG